MSAPWQPTTANALPQWVIYRGARDVSTEYLVRRWEIRPGTAVPCEGLGADTLDAARALVPAGMVRLERVPGDDPVIAEVWT